MAQVQGGKVFACGNSYAYSTFIYLGIGESGAFVAKDYGDFAGLSFLLA